MSGVRLAERDLVISLAPSHLKSLPTFSIRKLHSNNVRLLFFPSVLSLFSIQLGEEKDVILLDFLSLKDPGAARIPGRLLRFSSQLPTQQEQQWL